MVRSWSFHLHCLGKLCQYLNRKTENWQYLHRKTANTIAVSLVLSRLYYCNSCLWGRPKNQLLRLQRVQNTAERTVTQTKKSDHVFPILRELHWLPVEMRIDYKILSCVQLYEWHSPPVPSRANTLLPSSASSAVLHPISSLRPQCRPRKQQKTLGSQSIFQCCTQTVKQSAHYFERAYLEGNF